ncbi:hypothetical protein ACFPRA_14885 [Sporosarcina soli]|uniref:Spore coat protein D n=1 Tax=Sporosarcina soli TaxID=334736 RepID=A0ABW0TP83_9BACL
MMQQGNWHQGGCHRNQVQPVVCPTQYRFHNEFVPQEVPFIHPIVNVNRINTVQFPRHFYTETTQNVPGETLRARPGFGPGMGGPGFGGPGYGPGFGGPGFGGPGFGPGFGRNRWR